MRRTVIAAVVLAAALLSGCGSPAHDRCVNAVRQAYMDADKVLQQPIDLDRFCTVQNDHPPGLGLP